MGKPLFFYVADALRDAGLFDQLVIDTDSEELARLARERYGAWVRIVARPPELCGDFVPMNDVLAHDIAAVGAGSDFLQTHSTNPFLKAETLAGAVAMYQTGKSEGRLDSVFSVNALQSRLYDKHLRPMNHDPARLVRTQDLDVVYEENSNFYLFSDASFRRTRHRIGSQPGVFVMNRNSVESLDIDDISDWQFAEAILSAAAVR